MGGLNTLLDIDMVGPGRTWLNTVGHNAVGHGGHGGQSQRWPKPVMGHGSHGRAVLGTTGPGETIYT